MDNSLIIQEGTERNYFTAIVKLLKSYSLHHMWDFLEAVLAASLGEACRNMSMDSQCWMNWSYN